MKSKSFVGMFFIITALLFGCKEGGPKAGVEGYPPNAVVEEYDDVPGLARVKVVENDKVMGEGDYLDKKHHGSWTEFEKSGLVKSVTTYSEGLRQGVAIYVDNQGYIERKENYHNDVLEGEYKVYDRRRLIEERTYQNGQLHGVVKKFYQSGKLMEEAPYEEGKLNGIAKWYDEKGNLMIAYEYKDNELVNKSAVDLDSTQAISKIEN